MTLHSQKRNRNLERILGENFQVYGRCGNILSFKVLSTRKSNSIINIETGETLFNGTVCKYRDLYYFNEEINDTTFRIFALKINDSLIYGLQNYLQYFQIDTTIEGGSYPELVKLIDKKRNVIRLHPDKKILRRLFTSIIDNTEPFEIVRANNILTNNIFTTNNKEDLATQIEPDDFEMISTVYPNPTTDTLNVKLQQKIISTFQLTDLNGKIILQGQLNEIVNKIDISNQNAGIYALTIINPIDKQRETIKIVKIE